MKKMMKIYFSHPSVQLYFLMLFLMIGISVKLGLWEGHSVYFILPVFLAPFVEWVAHKHLLHRIVPKDSAWAYEYQKKLHYNHHKDPSDPYWAFAPRSSAFFIFGVIFLAFSLLGWGWESGFAATTMAVAYFLFYEWVHLGHHMAGYDHFTSFGQYMKKAHMWHHFSNENYWWGVTSPLADYVLKTFPDPKKVPHSPHVRDISQSKGPIGTLAKAKN